MSTENNKSYSVRHGHKQPKPIQHESMDRDLRNSLWSKFCACSPSNQSPLSHYLNSIFESIWVNFLKRPIDEYNNYSSDKNKIFVKDIFLKSKWYMVFDLIEFIIKKNPSNSSYQEKINSFIDECNHAFQEENSAYRIINQLVTPIISEQEINAIETAMATPYHDASNHIKSALILLSRRENPDYENSIKESISAVESIAKEITGKEKSLTALTQELKLHPNLKNGLDEIYNWTSKEGGIRHGKSGKTLAINQNTARFMLITCSAFVNYIVTENPKKP